ncbi:MAG: Ger(x)C family spore germination protein [Clostridiaceae bacterium]|nr:Ger(x)C family spore germination protein [Clostridiaceae bacterium]
MEMRTRMAALLTAIVIMSATLLSGCWNLTEIDQLAVVAGVAIDKGQNDRLRITVETVEVGFGKESEPKPRILTMEGETIFDAVRHIVSMLGKRLYWSHAKVVIICPELAEDGVLQVLDWFSRDSETRTDINILVSKGVTASEILMSHPISETVVSYEIHKILDSQKRLNHAPDIEVWKFANEMESKGIAAIAPVVELKSVDSVKGPNVDGTAIFRGDKLSGFADGIDTMCLLFIRDEISGGILVVKEEDRGKENEASLEILNSKTKVSPVIRNGSVEIDISVKTDVAIDEINTSINMMTEDRRNKLRLAAENMLKARIEGIIEKAQKEYAADIFGFGDKLRKKHPSAWSIMEQDWHNTFKDLKTNVEVEVQISNSTMLSKPLEVGY